MGALIAGWAAAALMALSTIAVPHMAPMPEGSRDARTRQALWALRAPSGPDRLHVHVIAADCSCTDRLFAHLVRRGPFPGTDEIVLFVGSDPAKEARARAAGFRYAAVSAAQLAARFGLEAAPVLFAFDAARLRYAGGYFDHPSAIRPLDEAIHARLGAGESPEGLPVYGCAVSAPLRRSLDPLGIAYPD